MLKPILFNTQMVKAILSGEKTVTRRPIKPHFREDEGGFQVCTNRATGERWMEKTDWDEGSFDSPRIVRPPYEPGDVLYVRETWAPLYPDMESNTPCGYLYKADRDGVYGEEYYNAYDQKYPGGKNWVWEGIWRPSIHMPREAARLFLRVRDMRIEKLKDMTVDDVHHEGISIAEGFRDWIALWDSTVKDKSKYGWSANPFVWVIAFETIKGFKVSNGEPLQEIG